MHACNQAGWPVCPTLRSRLVMNVVGLPAPPPLPPTYFSYTCYSPHPHPPPTYWSCKQRRRMPPRTAESSLFRHTAGRRRWVTPAQRPSAVPSPRCPSTGSPPPWQKRPAPLQPPHVHRTRPPCPVPTCSPGTLWGWGAATRGCSTPGTQSG